MAAILKKLRDTKQKPFDIEPVKLPMPAFSKDSLAALVKLKNPKLTEQIEKLDEEKYTQEEEPADTLIEKEEPALIGAKALGMHGEEITYNSKQQEFIDLVASGASCVLLGAAGTGKTTCSKGANEALIASGASAILQAEDHKHLVSGCPGTRCRGSRWAAWWMASPPRWPAFWLRLSPGTRGCIRRWGSAAEAPGRPKSAHEKSRRAKHARRLSRSILHVEYQFVNRCV